MELDLTSDPLSLVRSLPTKKIPTDQIKLRDDLEIDDIFLKKYTSFIQGKLKAYKTRIRLKNIKPGFYRHTNEGLVYKCDDKPQNDVEYIKELIHLGHRPALFLYINVNEHDDERFLCPDDVIAYYAYKQLNISKPPAVILGSKKHFDESCYVIKSIICKNNDEHLEYLDSFHPVAHDLHPSILGVKKPPYNKCFEQLIDAVKETKVRLKNFHKGGDVKLHYHHTLYSILHRIEETLTSMKILYEHKFIINAAVLVRSLYELSLTFYIDWLAPQTIYRFLQLSSLISEKEWEKKCSSYFREDIKGGVSRSDAQKLKDARMKQYHLASKVSEKARLFPFGEQHHKDVYSFLSKITHHDFSMTARYTHTLEHGDESIFNKDAMDTTIYCADFFVSAVVTKIIDDIGQVGEYHLENADI